MHPARSKLDWFKQTILPHEAALRGRLRRVLPHSSELDDMVSETMARAFAVEDYRRVTNGRSYLFTIARNLVIDEARRAKVVSYEVIADLDLIADDMSAERKLQARDELRRLETIIDSLPIQCRRAFILRRLHGRPVKEIAEEMGLSVSTVDKHIARAALKVMQAIGKHEGFGFGSSRGSSQRLVGDRSRSGPAVS
ncbi:sigma-70 family RNA polymerase sigma factor [Novosphingobium beihaiensis]|uniref:Sigma-70 family RNA polymerase sigma factor n=1 Tax=Novosphingobium beihaiensis TaxID=2930389 RepID=A0ABT0BL19_9SPHN|nr:sigma-70 family RNA polymerase sigma factor [Novosphingobium beihaiensis]MCJ2185747.1 sigma-70 family RNA polymerase sigma factor [Novosphingobium beihaiensis]